MFDKEKYWKRRKAGKRGQEPVNPVVGFHSKVDWTPNPPTKKSLKRKE